MSRKLTTCMNCGETREIAAHGLCFTCYRREERRDDSAWAKPGRHAPDVAKAQRKTRKALMKMMDALDEIESGNLVPAATLEAWRALLQPEVSRIALSLGGVNSEQQKLSEQFTIPELVPVNSEQQTTSSLFTESLHTKYRPATLDQFVGLEGPVQTCKSFLMSPHSAAFLFVGPSGTGKTSMARAMADAIPAQLLHIPSSKCKLEIVEQAIEACHYMPFEEKFHLVLVDEADQMSSAAQLAFLSVLDGSAFPKNTIFVFTANSTEGLDERFLSRTMVVPFSSNSKDIISVLERVWLKEGFDMDKPDLAAIATKAEGNIRAALMLLEAETLVAV